jgi:hypothetical protein
MKLSLPRSSVFLIGACLLGAAFAALFGVKYPVAVGWGYLVEGGDEVTYGPHPVAVTVMWTCLVVATMLVVRGIAAYWGPLAQARVRAGAAIGFVAGLVAGSIMWWLAQPLGYGNGGWTLAELSLRLSNMIGPLAAGLDLEFLGIGLRGITFVGPAIAWAIYGAVIGLARHAWTRHKSAPYQAAA